MAERTKERITLTRAAWCRLRVDGDPSLVVAVRFENTPSGRVGIAEMTVARFPGVTADALRAIRVGRIEAWANGQGRDDVLAALAARATVRPDDLAEIDDQERADAHKRATWGTSPEAIAAEEARMAEAAKLGVAEQVAAGVVAIGYGLDGVATPLRSRVRNLRLRVPDGQPKPDRFYEEVARLYTGLALNTSRPAAVLAEANGVSPARIHGWIKEARRRGLLAPGERQARKP